MAASGRAGSPREDRTSTSSWSTAWSWSGGSRPSEASGARPDTLNFMCLPEGPLPGELADFGLSLLGDSEAPTWSSLRHYDAHMIDALRGRGFSVLLTQLLLVKELAVRVPVRGRDWCHRSDELGESFIARQVATRTQDPKWDEEIELLARALPPDLAQALHERTDPRELLEIVLDLGREPEARVPGREVLLANHPVSASDLEHVADNVGQFGRQQPRRDRADAPPRRRSATGPGIIGLTCASAARSTARATSSATCRGSGRSICCSAGPASARRRCCASARAC